MNTNLLFVIAELLVLAGLLIFKLTQKTTPLPTTPPLTPPPAGTTGASASSIKRRKTLSLSYALALIVSAHIMWIIWHGFKSAMTAVSGAVTGLSGFWLLILVGVLVLAVAVYDNTIFKEDDKVSWKKRWRAWRSKFYFAILWTAIIAVVNLLMKHFDSAIWLALWKFKGEGIWSFWVVNILLIVGIVLAVNTDDDQKKIKNCGKIIVAIALIAWIAAYNRYQDPRDLAAASLPATPPPPPPAPSTRWSDAQTHKTKRVEWSIPITPERYETDEGLVEVIMDGNTEQILPWNVKAQGPDVVQLRVPASVKFIQIRSTTKDIVVYGTPYHKKH